MTLFGHYIVGRGLGGAWLGWGKKRSKYLRVDQSGSEWIRAQFSSTAITDMPTLPFWAGVSRFKSKF